MEKFNYVLVNNGNKCFVNGKKSTDASIFGLNSHSVLQAHLFYGLPKKAFCKKKALA